MRNVTVEQVLELHALVLEQSGGTPGLRDRGALESAVAQPQMAFGGVEMYPTLAAKAGALCYSLVQNHAFVDGNKRIGHAAMEVLLVVNGFELDADVDEQERVIFSVASSQTSRDELIAWVESHVVPRR